MYIIIDNKNVKIKECRNLITKLVSFTFKVETIETGIFLHSRNWFHTFFMYQNIDVAMTNENNKILYLYQNVKPWRLFFPKSDVTHTYLFGSNMMDKYSVNDTLKVKQ